MTKNALVIQSSKEFTEKVIAIKEYLGINSNSDVVRYAVTQTHRKLFPEENNKE